MPAVLWSGGLDSTLVLVGLLKETYKKEPVRSLAVDHKHMAGNAGNLAARQKLLRYFKGQRWELEHHEIRIETEAFQGSYPYTLGSYLYTQPPVWLLNAVPCLGPSEDLAVGYIRGDDVWHYRTELIGAFDQLQKLRGGTGKLLFPLEWEKKYEVLARMRDLKLVSRCWWCEGAGPRPCHRCTSCTTHNAAAEFLDRPVRRLSIYNQGKSKKARKQNTG